MVTELMRAPQTKENQDTDLGLVSIIMPNYNSEKYLEDTIKSILAQTYPNWELLFVDDCSTDNSLSIIEHFKDDRIRVFRNDKNCGAAVSRNIALEHACGRWIAFLDSDDLWHQDKLSLQISFMLKNKCAFSFTHYYFDRNDGKLSEFAPSKDLYDYKTILKHCYIACPTVMYDISILGKVYMPTEAVKREDFGCWLKVLKQGFKAYCFHYPLTTVKIHAGSVSYNKFKMIKYQWRVYRKIENISFFKSIYYLACWAVKGLLKYI